MVSKPDLLVGLDIGTTEVRCAVGLEPVKDDDKIQVLGVGTARNYGLKKGVIAQHSEVVESVSAAIEQVQVMTGRKIKAATVNINGHQLKAQIARAEVAVGNLERRVLSRDINLVSEQVQASQIGKNQVLIQMFPREYRVDKQKSIKDPLNMTGRVLGLESLLVKAPSHHFEALNQVFAEIGVRINSLTFSSLAAWEAIFDKSISDAGLAVADIGAATTNLIVIKDGEVEHVAVIPIGGNQVTNDLAIGLKVDQETAEFIKVNYASLAFKGRGTRTIFIGGRKIIFSPALAAGIVQDRLEELSDKIKQQLIKIDHQHKLPGGLLVVGGSSQIKGLVPLLKQELQLSVQLGRLRQFDGLVESISKNRHHITVIGLMALDSILNPKPQINVVEMVQTRAQVIGSSLIKLLNKIRKTKE